MVLRESVITLQGTRTLGDFQRAEYFTWFRRLWSQALMLAFFLLIFTAAFVAYVQGQHNSFVNVIPFVVLFLLWAASGVVIPLQAAKRKLAGLKWLGEATTFTFEAEGIRMASASFSSETRWSVVKEVCETKSLFLLRSGEQSAITLPKRFFASAAEIDAWKELVQAQMKCRRVAVRGIAARWC